MSKFCVVSKFISNAYLLDYYFVYLRCITGRCNIIEVGFFSFREQTQLFMFIIDLVS